MIKLDIINEVVARTGITKTKAELAVETVFESMKKALAHGNRIELRGFGVFNVRPRKTGIGRRYSTVEEAMGGVGSDMRLWARDSARTSVRCYYERAVPSTEYLAARKNLGQVRNRA